jgi:transposase
MDDATGLAEALVGLDGFRVLDVQENPDEVCITVETTADVVGCPSCGVRALAKERKRVDIRDLPCFGRPARLVWLKRRWCCADPDCEQKTWTEGSPHVPSRSVLTVRAGAEATRQVGALALPVAVVARELGVCWWTVMDAVELHGTPLVDDPARVGHVRALGIDETSFLSATREHATLYATGMVDLDDPKVIDMIEGNSAADLRRWCAEQDPRWLETIEVVATDLAESYRRRHRRAPRAHCARRGSLPRRARRQPGRRQGAPPGPERDPRAPGAQGRPALSDPKAPPRRLRASRRARP